MANRTVSFGGDVALVDAGGDRCKGDWFGNAEATAALGNEVMTASGALVIAFFPLSIPNSFSCYLRTGRPERRNHRPETTRPVRGTWNGGVERGLDG